MDGEQDRDYPPHPLRALPIILVPRAHNRLRFGALLPQPTPQSSGSPKAPPGGAGAHVHPSRLTPWPPPRMQSRACTYVHGPHLHTCPSTTKLFPRPGTGHTWARRQADAQSCTDRRPQIGGRSQGRGLLGRTVPAVTASGPSCQPGLRPDGESSGGEETAGPPHPSRARPGPRGVSASSAP